MLLMATLRKVLMCIVFLAHFKAGEVKRMMRETRSERRETERPVTVI